MDLEDVAARERSIAGTAERMAKELATSRASSSTASADLKEMRTQVNAMQKAIKGKDRQLTELKSTLKENGEVSPSKSLLAVFVMLSHCAWLLNEKHCHSETGRCGCAALSQSCSHLCWCSDHGPLPVIRPVVCTCDVLLALAGLGVGRCFVVVTKRFMRSHAP